nr:hypothetical protein [Tanacetum cinerariifolium]
TVSSINDVLVSLVGMARIGYNCPPKVLVIFNPETCKSQTIDKLPQTLQSFHPTCYSGDESLFTCDSTPNIVDDSPNVFNPPPQPSKYSYEFCRNDAYYGYDRLPQNSCYNSNSFGFDQFLPQQLPVIDQTPLEESIKNLRIAFQAWSENIMRKKEEEEKQITEKQAAKARYWKILICYDDDEDYTIAITPKEPGNSLSKGDENPNTIPILRYFASLKIDYLLDEFAGELILLKSIPPKIDKVDCDPKEEIRLSDLFMEEIDLFLAFDGSIPTGIDNDYSDSEGDNIFLERLLHNDHIPLPDTLDFSNVVRVFLPFITYSVTSSILLSSESEDTIFDLDISNYHFSSLEPVVSHWSGTFMKFNFYPNILNESSMEILSSTCFPMDK